MGILQRIDPGNTNKAHYCDQAWQWADAMITAAERREAHARAEAERLAARDAAAAADAARTPTTTASGDASTPTTEASTTTTGSDR